MSPSGASLCPLVLLVLLGAAMASVIPCQSIPQKLQDDHDFIADVLKLKEPEVGGKPLFDSVINNSYQRKVHVMNATLNVYSRIFSSLLQSEQQAAAPLLEQLGSDRERSTVRSVLKMLQQKMEELRRRLGQLHPEREDVLSQLRNITVNDPLVQRKALAQFKEVYQAASLIGHPKC
ncbi:uncharacterized protein AB9W97_005625 [Spinachia spinachia]